MFITPTSPILVLLAWLYGLIGACSLLVLHPKIRRPEGVKVRHAILSWWPVSLVGGLMVAFGPGPALGVFALVSAATLREFLRMLPPADRSPLLDGLAYAAIPLHYGAMLTGSPALIYGGVAAWAALVLPVARMFTRGPEGFLGASARLLFGVLLCVLALGHVPMIFLLEHPIGPAGPEGLAGLLMLLVMVSDAGQFISGKLAGRHPLVPRLSPKKTWEGLAGGALITAGVGFAAAPLVTPFGRPLGAALGLGICALGLVGDLLVSAIKRDAGVKDTGSAIPGQGGILDRCDSMLLTAPLYVTLLVTGVLA